MSIVFVQCLIVLVLAVARVINRDAVSTVALGLSIFTFIAVLWSPLSILQLIVIWVTAGMLTGGGGTPDPAPADIDRLPARSTSAPRDQIAARRDQLNFDRGEESQSEDELGSTPAGLSASSQSDHAAVAALLAAVQRPRLVSRTTREAIQQVATTRDIRELFHFTKAANLNSILVNGLRSRAWIEASGWHTPFNDQVRLDGYPHATCLSISFINDRLFHSLRYAAREEQWVILRLAPSILWQKTCAFHRRNAADHRERDRDVDERTGPRAFEAMFEELENSLSRERQRLYLRDPTDIQAEVLVFDAIEPSYITGLAFDDDTVRRRYEGIGGDRAVELRGSREGIFGKRAWVREGSG